MKRYPGSLILALMEASNPPAASQSPNPVIGFLLGFVGCATTFFAIAGVSIASRGRDSSGPVGILVVITVLVTVFYFCRNRPFALTCLLGMGAVHVAFALRFLSMPAAYRPSMAGARLGVGLVMGIVAIGFLVARNARLREQKQRLASNTTPAEAHAPIAENFVEFADELVAVERPAPLPPATTTEEDVIATARLMLAERADDPVMQPFLKVFDKSPMDEVDARALIDFIGSRAR